MAHRPPAWVLVLPAHVLARFGTPAFHQFLDGLVDPALPRAARRAQQSAIDAQASLVQACHAMEHLFQVAPSLVRIRPCWLPKTSGALPAMSFRLYLTTRKAPAPDAALQGPSYQISRQNPGCGFPVEEERYLPWECPPCFDTPQAKHALQEVFGFCLDIDVLAWATLPPMLLLGGETEFSQSGVRAAMEQDLAPFLAQVRQWALDQDLEPTPVHPILPPAPRL